MSESDALVAGFCIAAVVALALIGGAIYLLVLGISAVL